MTRYCVVMLNDEPSVLIKYEAEKDRSKEISKAVGVELDKEIAEHYYPDTDDSVVDKALKSIKLKCEILDMTTAEVE